MEIIVIIIIKKNIGNVKRESEGESPTSKCLELTFPTMEFSSFCVKVDFYFASIHYNILNLILSMMLRGRILEEYLYVDKSVILL